MTLVLVWKGLVLGGWPTKTEVIWVPGIYIYICIHILLSFLSLTDLVAFFLIKISQSYQLRVAKPALPAKPHGLCNWSVWNCEDEVIGGRQNTWNFESSLRTSLELSMARQFHGTKPVPRGKNRFTVSLYRDFGYKWTMNKYIHTFIPPKNNSKFFWTPQFHKKIRSKSLFAPLRRPTVLQWPRETVGRIKHPLRRDPDELKVTRKLGSI